MMRSRFNKSLQGLPLNIASIKEYKEMQEEDDETLDFNVNSASTEPDEKLYRCSMCSFSSNVERTTTMHFKYCHRSVFDSNGNKEPIIETSHQEAASYGESSVPTQINNQVTPKSRKINKNMFGCRHCEFSTGIYACLKTHEKNHGKNKKFKCSHCNYASNVKSAVTRHFKNQHRSLHNNADSTQIGIDESDHESQAGDMAESLENNNGEWIPMDTTVNDFRVEQHNTADKTKSASPGDALEQGNLNENDYSVPSSASLPEVHSKYKKVEMKFGAQEYSASKEEARKELEKMIEIGRSRVEIQKEKVKMAEQILTNVSSKYSDLDKKIKEMSTRKIALESDLTIKESETVAPPPQEKSATEDDQASTEIIVHSLKGDENRMGSEMRLLEVEEGILTEELKRAEEVYGKANRVLQALNSKLEELELELKKHADK